MTRIRAERPAIVFVIVATVVAVVAIGVNLHDSAVSAAICPDEVMGCGPYDLLLIVLAVWAAVVGTVAVLVTTLVLLLLRRRGVLPAVICSVIVIACFIAQIPLERPLAELIAAES